jgi:hypothetical protein
MNKRGGRMKAVFFMILTFFFLAGCNKSLDVQPVTSYPIQSGNIWMYAGIDTVYHFRPLVSTVHFKDTAVHWTTRIDSLGEVILQDSVHTWAFRSTDSFDTSHVIGYHYYTRNNDSLFLYAYSSASGGLPKKLSGYHLVFQGITFGSLGELHQYIRQAERIPGYSATGTIVYEERPPKAMVFPLRVGSQWTFRERGYPFFIGKNITGTASVPTPAGEFAAFKIAWWWDMDNNNIADTNIEAFDYVTNNGLMKRTIVFKNATITNGDPTPLGYVDIKEEYSITSFMIQ